MSKPESIYVEELEWEGEVYISELIDEQDFSNLDPVTQVQSVCFTDNDQVVIYKDTDGNYGLPGGSIEESEGYEQALRRELYEEAAVKVIKHHPLLYLRTYKNTEPENISYQLRYWAWVELLDESVDDPDGHAVAREVVSIPEALEKLGWGQMAEVYFKKALEDRG